MKFDNLHHCFPVFIQNLKHRPVVSELLTFYLFQNLIVSSIMMTNVINLIWIVHISAFQFHFFLPHLEHPPRVSEPLTLVILARSRRPAACSEEASSTTSSPSFLYGLCPIVLDQISAKTGWSEWEQRWGDITDRAVKGHWIKTLERRLLT